MHLILTLKYFSVALKGWMNSDDVEQHYDAMLWRSNLKLDRYQKIVYYLNKELYNVQDNVQFFVPYGVQWLKLEPTRS